jgi:hypothetical protein
MGNKQSFDLQQFSTAHSAPPMTGTPQKKRVVFISVMGLHQSWKDCPISLLQSCILILPIKRKWISQKRKSSDHDFSVLRDEDFLKLLRWKNEQQLLFCMEDEVDPKHPAIAAFDDECGFDSNVAPFWKLLSFELAKLTDPTTGLKYSPLKLDERWWKHQCEQKNTELDLSQIISELYFLNMRFSTISEILTKSNASLEVLKKYGTSATAKASCSYSSLLGSQLQLIGNDDEYKSDNDGVCAPDAAQTVWWVSEEYESDFLNDDSNDGNGQHCGKTESCVVKNVPSLQNHPTM